MCRPKKEQYCQTIEIHWEQHGKTVADRQGFVPVVVLLQYSLTRKPWLIEEIRRELAETLLTIHSSIKTSRSTLDETKNSNMRIF